MAAVHTMPFRIVVPGDGINSFYEVGTNGRGYLSSLIIYSPTNATYDVALYNRKFSEAATDIQLVRASSGTAAEIVTKTKHNLQVGDLVTIAGCHADYNGTNIYVTKVKDLYTLETEKTFTSQQQQGTIQLAIGTAFWPLWEVFQPGSASSNYFRFGQTDSNKWMPAYKNRDPEGPVNTVKALYLKFDKAGTYYGTITTVGLHT